MIRIAALLLVLAPSALASIRGTVFDTTGSPVAGARVTGYRPATPFDERARLARGAEREVLASAKTGDDGAFMLEPKRGGVFEVHVAHDRVTPQFAYALDGQTDLAIDVTARESRPGRVTAGGKPVANALVVAERSGLPVWSARTDEKGAFELPDSGATWADGLRVVHPQHAIFTMPLRTSKRALEVTLARGTAITGRVTRKGGRAVAGAHILEDGWPVAVSSEDGTFAVAHASGKTIVAIAGAERGTARGTDIEVQPGKSIAGTVHDANKRPLPGAVVTVWDQAGETTLAVADERGTYRVDHRAAVSNKVYIQDIDELQFGVVDVNLRTLDTARADFTARTKTQLRGKVVDEKKRPITGALVFPFMFDTGALIGRTRISGVPSARTGADGSFRLALPPGYKFRLQAMHRDYAVAATEKMTMIADKAPVTITLHEGIVLRGVVIGTDDKPIAGAGIAAFQDARDDFTKISAALAGDSLAPIALSNAEGRFAVRLNDAPHALGVWKEGYIGTDVTALQPQRDAPPLKIVLERGVEIRGRVTSKNAKGKISGMVMAENDLGHGGSTFTDDGGAFSITSLAPGTYALTFMNEDNQSVEKSVDAPAANVVLELPAKAEIRGRVIDKLTREPLQNYSVSAEVAGEFSNHQARDEETFQLYVPPGDAEITITAEGYLREVAHAVADLAKPAEVTIALARGRTISGRVTAEGGLPVEKAMISALGAETVSVPNVVSSEDGSYELAGAPRESGFVLQFERKGYVSRRVTIESGERDQRVDVTLMKGKSAHGRVVTSTGAPVEGARVSAQPVTRDSGYQSTLSAADGAFELEGLGEGRYSLSASHDEHGSAELTDVDFTKPIVIVFKPSPGTGTIHGKVAGIEKLGAMQTMVTAGQRSAAIARDGTYKIEQIPAGQVEVQVHAFSTRIQINTSSKVVTLAANDDLEVNLALHSDITLRGTITDGGQPLAAGAAITFNHADASWSTKTREGGTYELLAVEPGAYDVSVTTPRGEFKTRYRVTGAAVFDIAVAFAQLEGRVVATGAPVAGATVEVTRAGSDDAQEVTTDAAGGFRFSLAESESYVVIASKKGFASAVRRLDRPRAPIVLELTRADALRVHLVDARDGRTLDGYVVVTDPAGLVAGRADELRDDVLPVVLNPGAYRVSVSAQGFASQSAHATLPREGELRFALTPGGTLVIHAERGAGDLVKLVMPNGEEYVRCQCNRIAEIRLTGLTTNVDHVAPGPYTMYVYAEGGQVKSAHQVTIEEGKTTTVAVE